MEAPQSVREAALAAFQRADDLPVLPVSDDRQAPTGGEDGAGTRRVVVFEDDARSVHLTIEYQGRTKTLKAVVHDPDGRVVASAATLSSAKADVALQLAGADLSLTTEASGPVTLVVTGAGPAFRTSWINL